MNNGVFATDLRDLLVALRQRSPVVLGVTESVRRRLLRRYLDASQRNLPLHVAALAVLLFGVVDSASWLSRGIVFVLLSALMSVRWWLADRVLADLQHGIRRSTLAHDLMLLLTLLGWGVSPCLVTTFVPGTDFFALCFVGLGIAMALDPPVATPPAPGIALSPATTAL